MAQYQIDNRQAPIDMQTDDAVLRTIQNAKNLLMTRKGEVPYDRLRGFDGGLLALPISELKQKLIREVDRVMLWEPDADVVKATCSLDENNEVYIVVTLEIDLEEV